MARNSSKIHPNARLWIITTVILSIALVIKTEGKVTQTVQPQGAVIAYYKNDYQRYAIERLTEMDKIEQYPCLFELWTEESNWRPNARNKSSGALGIAQLMPATWVNIKMQPTLDGYKQVNAGLAYIERKYGKSNGICRAYAHHLAKGWY
jgi:hypothetical protein